MLSPKQNKKELQKRKEGLEHAAMMMAAEGLSIPEDIATELATVKTQLSQLGGASPSRSWTSWLGQNIEGYNLQERLSSGTYSNVFRAVHEKTGEERAFKIANNEEAISSEDADDFSKKALSFNLEICQAIELPPNKVIDLESRKLLNDNSGVFVKVLSSGYADKFFYYSMPLLLGQSLQDLMKLTDMPFLDFVIDVFSRLCTMLEKISFSGDGTHGNLQPDNIFVTKTDIVLLSPGCFEVIDPVSTSPFMITTPAYYPFFEPDDVYALGLSFWESICKRHPLAVKDLPERPELFEEELLQMLEYRKSLNHAPLFHFLRLLPPSSVRSDLTSEAEQFMMKALKLGFSSDGRICASPGFKQAAQFDVALQQMTKQGIRRKI